jgi:hypothetical protein
MPIDREEDWQPFVQGSFFPAQSGIYAGKIEPITTLELISKPIIRVSARSIDIAARRWWLAGYLAQEIGLTMELQTWRIPLNRRKLIISIGRFERYRLRFEAVQWLRNLYVEIDTYEGN